MPSLLVISEANGFVAVKFKPVKLLYRRRTAIVTLTLNALA